MFGGDIYQQAAITDYHFLIQIAWDHITVSEGDFQNFTNKIVLVIISKERHLHQHN